MTSSLFRPFRRRAKTPENPTAGGRLVYAIGDVHGRYDLLKDILAQVVKDSRSRLSRERPLLVLCGDYVDRGPQSADVIEALVWLRTQSDFEVCALKGNHEQALLDFLETPEEGGSWLRFGGAATLLSYGVSPPDPDADDEDLVRARDELLEKLPEAHLRLLEGLQSMLVVGDYAFVHAGIRPGVPLQEQEESDLLWIRQEFLEARGPFEKIIVHGHTWQAEHPQIFEHRLGIDTGAYSTGVLTAVRLDDEGVSVFQTSPSVPAEPPPAI